MKSDIYDIIVIGGGPAGMFAAGSAASSGAKVLLVEKNNTLGKKLLITGKGRCNITHAADNISIFIEALGRNGKFLYSAMNRFGIDDIINFFNERGLDTVIERGNRIFPLSGRSEGVLTVLIDYLRKNNVTIKTGLEVKGLNFEDSILTGIETDDKIIYGDKFIITTGGLSYPSTGSTGDGYKFAKDKGLSLISPEPALTPILIKEKFISELKGLDLKNISIEIYRNNKLFEREFGEAGFTKNGMDGPIILDMSKKIGRCKDDLELFIDLKPALDFKKLDKRICRDFKENHKHEFKNSLNKLLPQKIIPIIIQLSNIEPDKICNHITKDERQGLVKLIKKFKLNIKGVSGFKRAIITAGGIDLKEIDSKTMRSKKIPNLFFAGEILDLDGPTGGYNLQICWSSAYVAGISAAAEI
jgi:predicted Rossmann fold flavoprotein